MIRSSSQIVSPAQPNRLSNQEMIIKRDVYDALPLFYQAFVDVMVNRGEWRIIDGGAHAAD
jgi:hypothetical protein